MRGKVICLIFSLTIGCTADDPAPAPVTPPAAAEVEASPATSTTGEASDDVIVIDVRTEKEWNSGHVERAMHIPHTEIAERIAEVTTNKDAKIVVYCAVGGRAGQAKKTLEDLGYTNVENAGGYDDVKDRF